MQEYLAMHRSQSPVLKPLGPNSEMQTDACLQMDPWIIITIHKLETTSMSISRRRGEYSGKYKQWNVP